jgi:hypothetical protein
MLRRPLTPPPPVATSPASPCADKLINYDYNNRHFRADIVIQPSSFPDPLSPINQTSYWIQDNLFIFDYFPLPSCVVSRGWGGDAA